MTSSTVTMKRDPYADLPAAPSFRLDSSLVADGETMPVAQRDRIFGGGGQDTSPDLAWSGFPNDTRSFIVTMYDPDAPIPSGFWHWAVINIPGSVTSLRRCPQEQAKPTRPSLADRTWQTMQGCAAIWVRDRHQAIHHTGISSSFPH